MPVFATTGSKLFIGPAVPWGAAVPNYAALSWTPVSRLESLGRLGSGWTEEEVGPAMGVGRPVVMKMTPEVRRMQIVTALDYSNAGQIALIRAEADGESLGYAFRIFLGNPGEPARRYFVGAVVSVEEVLDEASAVTMLAAEIAIQSDIIRKDSGA